MAKRYLLTLSEDERAHLFARTKKGTLSARKLASAYFLLRADAGPLDAALRERSRPGDQRKLDGKQEAFLIALACSTPPEG